MKRRIVSFVLALVLVFGLSITASAYTDKQFRAAEALYHLDLFRGTSSTSKVYKLDNVLTRMEGTVLLVRMLGKEAEANQVPETDNPFSDLGGKDISYGIKPVTYAKQQGLVNGTSATTFDPRGQMSDYMFLTLVLRSLGYKDGNKAGEGIDFVWNTPYELAKQVGLIADTTPDSEFTRGDAVLIFWNAMKANFKDSYRTLADSLISADVFTRADYNEAKEIWEFGFVLKDAETDNNDNDANPENPDDSDDKDNSTDVGNGDSTNDDQNANESTPDNNEPKDETDTTKPDDNTATKPDDSTNSENDGVVTYEEYTAMTGEEQQAFMGTFDSVPAFIEWYNAAKAEYDANRESIDVGSDGIIDLGDIINGQN